MQDILLRDDICDAVLFDLDNTLVEFISAKRRACAAVIEELGCGDPADLFSYFLRRRHGFEDYANIFDYLSDIGVTGSASYIDACIRYETVKIDTLRPYPGISDMLVHLRSAGLDLAVVTDADLEHAEARLKKTGLSRHFDVVITPDISGMKKPNPESFLMALDSLRIPAQRAITIGDSILRDIVPAQRLGMCTIHARYGDWHPDETRNSSVRTLWIDRPGFLPRLLFGNNNDFGSNKELGSNSDLLDIL